ncbi:hypothetical protein BZG06_10270 [Salinivibrio kushneri]|uniref:Uncharacterized protein n=1 Tax=Salinivibrio kushneri TaxID=1908198 RepID=A0AB36K865_9GAMM|nr:DUF692 domain-containing protein [Salinivibrio kushneri]OOE43893.1 hypothetical protein BZG06_10270 [Salinivibrio kushneri]OOE45283.1 hypothetical protein BZG09_04885 [Salinivibrio kushneri]
MDEATILTGVGLRQPHLTYFDHYRPKLGWLEIHSENYFRPHRPAFSTLMRLREDYAISCHGVGLSLGSDEPLDRAHLDKLCTLVKHVEPLFVSDHLSWSRIDGQHFHDLLPLPYTEQALRVFCANVQQVQDALQRPLLIENPSSYLSFAQGDYHEWEFLAEVHARTGCDLLLDLNNVHVSAFNHHFSASTYLDAIPAHAVKEIHLAGFTVKHTPAGEIWIDTHNQPVSEAVWTLYQQWIDRHGPRHTLIEWDSDLLTPERLLAEAAKAHHRLARHKEAV